LRSDFRERVGQSLIEFREHGLENKQTTANRQS
jgi:hypothetical protein